MFWLDLSCLPWVAKLVALVRQTVVIFNVLYSPIQGLFKDIGSLVFTIYVHVLTLQSKENSFVLANLFMIAVNVFYFSSYYLFV